MSRKKLEMLLEEGEKLSCSECIIFRSTNCVKCHSKFDKKAHDKCPTTIGNKLPKNGLKKYKNYKHRDEIVYVKCNIKEKPNANNQIIEIDSDDDEAGMNHFNVEVIEVDTDSDIDFPKNQRAAHKKDNHVDSTNIPTNAGNIESFVIETGSVHTSNVVEVDKDCNSNICSNQCAAHENDDYVDTTDIPTSARNTESSCNQRSAHENEDHVDSTDMPRNVGNVESFVFRVETGSVHTSNVVEFDTDSKMDICSNQCAAHENDDYVDITDIPKSAVSIESPVFTMTISGVYTRNVHVDDKCDVLNDVTNQNGVESNADQIKTRKCEFCDKAFKSEKSLYAHMRRGHPKVRLNCALCYESLKNGFQLKQHFLTCHNGVSLTDKLYKFSERPATIGRKIKFNKRPPRECKTCNTKFKYKYDLDSHNVVMHDIFTCNQCRNGHVFKNVLFLERHIEKKHLGRYMCYYSGCNEIYDSALTFVEHVSACPKNPGWESLRQLPYDNLIQVNETANNIAT